MPGQKMHGKAARGRWFGNGAPTIHDRPRPRSDHAAARPACEATGGGGCLRALGTMHLDDPLAALGLAFIVLALAIFVIVYLLLWCAERRATTPVDEP